MAHDGNGTGWDVAAPGNSDNQSDGAKEIRDLRKAVGIRYNKEHDAATASSGGGEHKKGSAKAYYQTAFPSLRPDGATALGAADAGRVMVKDTTGAMHYWDGSGWQSEKIVDEDQITNGIVKKEHLKSGIMQGALPYAILRDEKSDTTNGGGCTGGTWGGTYHTRTLNTEHVDVGVIVSLASSQFTLGAGTYRIKARAPGYQCDQHQVRIRNITDGTTPAYGSIAKAGAGDTTITYSEVETEFTIAGDKVYELQHCFGTTKATNGQGPAASLGGLEVYAVVEIWKLL